MKELSSERKEHFEVVDSENKKEKKVYDEIKDRQTDELVIAFCGPLGSGVSTVAKKLIQSITEYKYDVEYIKVSELIKNNISLLPNIVKINNDSAHERISSLQNAGNALREKYGNDILSQFVIKEIAIKRGGLKDSNYDPEKPLKPESRRHVTIIDSLKHPEEVRLLKTVYGNLFYLFAILCPEEIRKHRLKESKRIDSGEEVKLMERDKSESIGFGQQLLDTLQYADFYIRNDDVNITLLKENVKRYIDLILGDLFITPTTEEYAMYCAQSAALKSACLSRQVGAAIVSKDGELISTGFNDVPKCGGGYYSDIDKENDGRCMKIYNQTCKNDEFKKRIFNDIESILSKYIKDKEEKNKALNEIHNHERLKNLLEYCRSVHAEMDAIINAGRIGNACLKNAVLYCTTFPCHNCSRHIIVSGITKVYYIEPYEKSLARQLHYDAIDFDHKINESPTNKVIFIPFEGVAPKQYMNLFMAEKRKVNGAKIKQDLKGSKPRVRQFLDPHIDYETKVVNHLKKITEKKA